MNTQTGSKYSSPTDGITETYSAGIVLMSLLDLGALSIPDWFVKLVRAFRVIRLFGRIDALKKMAAAVTASNFQMMNAFAILLIVLSICACDDTLPLPAHIALALGSHHSAISAVSCMPI
jgi:hypothetical protein